MRIYEVPGWEQGAKIRNKTWSGLDKNYYIFWDAEHDNWIDKDGDEWCFEHNSEVFTDDDWEALPVCPHCNGTGLPPEEKKTLKKGKKS